MAGRGTACLPCSCWAQLDSRLSQEASKRHTNPTMLPQIRLKTGDLMAVRRAAQLELGAARWVNPKTLSVCGFAAGMQCVKLVEVSSGGLNEQCNRSTL
jgi:hypothetical protein